KVMLAPNGDMIVAFAANLVAEPDRLTGRDALVDFVDHPWPGQRMVDGRDIIMEQVWIGLVEIDALFDDGLVIGMQGDAGGVVDAWPFQAAGLDHKGVVAAVAVLIEPLADGITQILRLRAVGGIVAAIRVDAAIKVMV